MSYKVTERTKRELEELIEWKRGMHGARGSIRMMPWGPTIIPPRTPRPILVPAEPPWRLLRVTGFTSPSALGGAKYWARIQRRKKGTKFAANSTNFLFATFYEDEDATVDVLLINALEQSTSTHDSGGYQIAFEVDPTADGIRVFLSYGLSYAC